MKNIPLLAVPNQSFSFVDTLNNRWDVRLKVARFCMVVDVSVNDMVMVEGQRIAVGTLVLPYSHLSIYGNLALFTEGDEADWQMFGTTQTLVYITPDEQDTIGFDALWSVSPPYMITPLTPPVNFTIEYVP